jgi:hypothetical protein
MSSEARRRELRKEQEKRMIREEEERARLEARSMYMKIEDAEDIRDLKPILHEITERLGL